MLTAPEQAQATLPLVVEAMRSIVRNSHAHDEHRIQAAALLVDIAGIRELREEWRIEEKNERVRPES